MERKVKKQHYNYILLKLNRYVFPMCLHIQNQCPYIPNKEAKSSFTYQYANASREPSDFAFITNLGTTVQGLGNNTSYLVLINPTSL